MKNQRLLSLQECIYLSLQYRRLIWMAPFAALGAAAGLRWGIALLESTTITRESAILLLPVFPALLLSYCAWRWRNTQPQLALLLISLTFSCILCSLAARRVLPQRQDISQLTRLSPIAGPVERRPITLRGWIAEVPQRSELSTQFPIECAETGIADNRRGVQGRLWLSLPPMPALEKQFGRTLEVGDAIQVEAELSALERPTNPGERDRSLYRILDNCWAQGRVRSPGNIRLLQAPPSFHFERRIHSIRKRLVLYYESAFENLSTPYPRATAQLMTAMAFGEGGLIEPLPRQVRDDFRAAGMSHILVASGTQISFLALMLLGTSKVLGVRKWPILLLIIPALCLYALIAGGAASIWRAAVAGICLAVALLQGRDPDALSLWSLALIVLLTLDPGQLFNLSFQFSFAATWGLIVVGPVVRNWLMRSIGDNAIITLAAFSLAAQAGVAPIVAYHFGTFSLAGLSANFIGIPLAGVLVGTSLAGLVAPVHTLHHLNYLLAHTIANTASVAAHLPGANLERPPLRLFWTVTIYVLLIVAVLMVQSSYLGARWSRQSFQEHIWIPLRAEVRGWWRRKQFVFRPVALLALIISVFALWFAWRAWSTRPQHLLLAMLDVRQGESILIRSPAQRSVLIDGGGLAQYERENVGRTVIIPYLQSRGVRKLDAMVITHADADHCNGLLSVVREVPVGLVLDGAQRDDVSAVEYLELRRELARRKIPVIAARAGQALNLGAGATLTVLAPLQPAFRDASSDNNNGAVLRLDYGKTSMLLTGDIERAAEERLVRRGARIKCTVLKVAHHGSKTSTSELFMRAASPQAALISAGRYNQFGHPNTEVLQRLAKRGVPAFRTDLNGAIEVFSDGQSCWIQAQK